MDLIIKHAPGAGWFDIIETGGRSTPVSFKNNRIHSAVEKQNSGYGVRINLAGKTGFSYTNDRDNLEETVKKAVLLSGYGDDEGFELPSRMERTFNPYDPSIESFDIKIEMEKAGEAISRIMEKFPGSNTDLGISRSTGNVRIMNSRGLDVSYKSSAYSAYIGTTHILDDGTKIDVSESLTSRKPEPFDRLADEVIKKMSLALVTRKLPGGKVPVILTPGAFSRMIGIVLSGLNARSVWKGISPFSDKIGARLFSASLNVTEDPLMSDSPYSFPFDDEGVPSRKKPLIESGVIKTFITDLKHAEKLGIEPTGNGSRDFSSLPAPSLSNVIISGPGISLADLIGGMGKGVLVEEFIGLGQSNTLTGDFSASLDLAFMVEKGEITGRVKDCMISGNLFRLLEGDIIFSRESRVTGSVTAPHVFFPSVNYTG
ncbi:MAG: TldD/PmbA family protein [Spirochaetes bacterium]|jgi:PmbA protein|nr:TldD/PmbA family protein [Spirochaetota bacterium]